MDGGAARGNASKDQVVGMVIDDGRRNGAGIVGDVAGTRCGGVGVPMMPTTRRVITVAASDDDGQRTTLGVMVSEAGPAVVVEAWPGE